MPAALVTTSCHNTRCFFRLRSVDDVVTTALTCRQRRQFDDTGHRCDRLSACLNAYTIPIDGESILGHDRRGIAATVLARQLGQTTQNRRRFIRP